MRTYSEALRNRTEYENKLTAAGYVVTGGGVDMQTMDWDIYIESPFIPGEEIGLHGYEAVNEILKNR